MRPNFCPNCGSRFKKHDITVRSIGEYECDCCCGWSGYVYTSSNEMEIVESKLDAINMQKYEM